ncbi:MAG: DUF4349 domain-containing protein, partial [Lachnospiraceae bacterium]|nr:DUF4349 domain-containing protein [Lachnospiraceae bacterium]
MMKKQIAFCLLAVSLGLGGCGGSSTSDSSGYKSEVATEDGGYYDDEMADTEEALASDETDSNGLSDFTENDGKTKSLTAKKISTEKLIFTCNISIDTLEFEKSTKELSALIEKYEGFLESESYSDGGSYNEYDYYYVEPGKKHDRYTATIRIPSDKYDEFLEKAGSLGDVRAKDSHVDNVSQEYTDLNTSLEVYEAAYKRYMDLLKEASDESYALELQAKITETQEKIAQIKTRMNRIDTDVAYSYINITIKEVSKYEDVPMPTDTFAQRMAGEVVDSLRGFGDFLEGLLVLIIHLLPFAVLFGVVAIIVFVIRKKVKSSPKYKAKQEEKQRKREEALAA